MSIEEYATMLKAYPHQVTNVELSLVCGTGKAHSECLKGAKDKKELAFYHVTDTLFGLSVFTNRWQPWHISTEMSRAEGLRVTQQALLWLEEKNAEIDNAPPKRGRKKPRWKFSIFGGSDFDDFLKLLRRKR